MISLLDNPIWKIPKAVFNKFISLFKKKEEKVEKPKRGRPKKK